MALRRFGKRLGKAATALTALIIGGAVAIVAIVSPQPVNALRNIVFDSFLRAKPRPFNAEMPVRIVDIDDESLARLGQWPWPRTIFARLIDQIGAQSPAVIGLDVIFSEPDRTSPERILSMLPPSPERDALAMRVETQGLSNDERLAQTFATTPVVAGIALNSSQNAAPVRAGFATAGDPPAPFLPHFSGAIAPIARLQESARGFGALNWIPDQDQVVRRVPTILVVGTQLIPSLAVETLRLAQDASTILVKSSNASNAGGFGASTGIVSLKIGEVVLDTDADGAVRVSFAGSRPERTIPAWKVLEGEVENGMFDGRIVLIGSSAAALADMRATPLNAVVPGVEVHAEVIEQALSNDRLARPDWAPGAEAVAIVVSAMLAAGVGFAFTPLTAAAIGMLCVSAVMIASWALFVGAHVLVDPALPSLAGLLAFGSTSVARWKTTDSERKAISHAFGHYLAPTLVKKLSDAPEKLILGGEQRDMTLLFSDVRGFTTLGETYRGDPQGLTRLINRLLTPLTDVIVARDGTIDKYMGDAIMAFWNAPLDIADHAAKACDAALAMHDALNNLNAQLRSESAASGRVHVDIDIGVGINTGECVVGNMGSSVRFDYSVLGDAVNLASRLEGQTRVYGVNILLGPETAHRVADRYAVIEIDRVRVKGRSAATTVYALIGDAAMLNDTAFQKLKRDVAEFLLAYRAQEWDLAVKRADALHTANANATLAQYAAIMRERIYVRSANPPVNDWDGVHVADQK